MSVNNGLNGLGGSPRKKARTEPEHKAIVVLGAQWGDEGKGKVVDMLAEDVDIVCRCQVQYFSLIIFGDFRNRNLRSRKIYGENFQP